jgi:leucyl aminopeptidase
MRFQSTLALALSASSALALSVPKRQIDGPSPSAELFTIELAPGETKVVTEAEKWELHNVCSQTLLLADLFQY